VRRAAIAPILAGVAGLAWFWLELTPPRLGFDDTDSPEVSLQFLRAHAETYAQAGTALLILAAALLVTTLIVADRLTGRASPVAVRSLTVTGIVSAACLFLFGVLRFSAEPILYIDGLDHAWGAAAYLAVQMTGVHGVEQGGTFALCAWIVGVSVLGVRAKVVPVALGLLAFVPAFRLVGLLVAPFVPLPDVTWVLGIAAIPLSLAWCLLLGIVLLRNSPVGGGEAQRIDGRS
jgi:hypothetical protein